MTGNFLKTAWRSLWKRKSFSFLNILGLAVGIAASLLIFLVIHNELNFDALHSNRNEIYRVTGYTANKSNGEITAKYSGTPMPLPDAMRMDFPQIKKLAAVSSIGQAQVYIPGKNNSEEKRFKESDGLYFTETSLYEVFDYKWVAGTYSGLKDINTVVLTESLAKKYFNSANAAIGQVLQLWSFRIPLTVVGVYKDLPANTDLPLRMGASYATLRTRIHPDNFTSPDAWNFSGNQQTFVLADKNQSQKSLEAQLASFVKKYYPSDPVNTRYLSFQPLADMHLDKDYETFSYNRLSSKELWSLGLIGAFLLFVACINFINLSTAQSVNRSREIGVRKVLGSNRSQLMRQFLQETALLTFLSLVLGCLLACCDVTVIK